MLARQIGHERQKAADAILGHYRDRFLPYAMLAPSGRFGLYVAAKAVLSPGDRVLISPITCRTVIYALLAAGVTPVFVDIELDTGNIDVSRLSHSDLNDARAIVTTNLYGNPDAVHDLKSMASSYDLLVIEDCAHVLHTRAGTQEIGSLGDISVFSFKKHFDELGGVVCARDPGVAAKLQARLTTETAMPSKAEEWLRYCQFRLTKATSPAIGRSFSSAYRRLRTAGGNRESDRQPRTVCVEQGPALSACLPTTATLLRMVAFLQRWQELIQARTLAARSLIARCPLPLKNNGSTDEVVYLALPFFSPDRDSIVAKLRSRNIPTYFLYTPAMSTIFRNCAKSSHGLDQERIDHWCRNILPVRPQFGEQFLEVLSQVGCGVEERPILKSASVA